MNKTQFLCLESKVNSWEYLFTKLPIKNLYYKYHEKTSLEAGTMKPTEVSFYLTINKQGSYQKDFKLKMHVKEINVLPEMFLQFPVFRY